MAEDKKPKVPIGRKGRNLDPSLNPEFSNVPAEAEQPNGSERVFHALWEIIKTVAFIILAAVLIRTFLIQPFFVEGQSMEPNFHNGNYLLVNQLSYTFGKPQRGDVIVFKAPPQPQDNYIKRIVGLPGETVELKNGEVVIYNEQHRNGVTLDESGYEPPDTQTEPESGETRWELGQDQYFVLGDNRLPGKSSDSRAWGPLDQKMVIGKAWLRIYPLAQFGFVKHQDFPDLSYQTGSVLALP